MAEADDDLRTNGSRPATRCRELEFLNAPSSIGGGSDDGSVVAALEAELRELEAALADRP